MQVIADIKEYLRVKRGSAFALLSKEHSSQLRRKFDNRRNHLKVKAKKYRKGKRCCHVFALTLENNSHFRLRASGITHLID